MAGEVGYRHSASRVTERSEFRLAAVAVFDIYGTCSDAHGATVHGDGSGGYIIAALTVGREIDGHGALRGDIGRYG